MDWHPDERVSLVCSDKNLHRCPCSYPTRSLGHVRCETCRMRVMCCGQSLRGRSWHTTIRSVDELPNCRVPQWHDIIEQLRNVPLVDCELVTQACRTVFPNKVHQLHLIGKSSRPRVYFLRHTALAVTAEKANGRSSTWA